MPGERLTYLFRQFAANEATKRELEEFYDLVGKTSDADVQQLMDEYSKTKPLSSSAENVDWDFMFSKIMNTRQTRVIPFGKIAWRRIAVAASIMLAVSTVAYFTFFKQERKGEELVNVEIKDVEAPKQSKAIITLEDGRNVPIDSLTSLTQNNVNLVKTADGKIVYSGNTDQVVYNTLTNPRGSRVIDIALGDGSRVWLNAGSSITYPIAFTGNERRVTLSGEAYFEVAKNASSPFKVNVGGESEVEVLGTHFNINAYSDEANMNTTLLEGSVKVTSLITQRSQIIIPGQQAQLDQSGQLSLNQHVDVDEVMAWKNGKFVFQDLDIRSVLRQISKWYDVDVEYSGTVTNELFVGVISRNVNVSEIIRMLENTAAVRLEIQGKKIIVK